MQPPPQNYDFFRECSLSPRIVLNLLIMTGNSLEYYEYLPYFVSLMK